MDNFVKTDDILKDMCGIIESSQKAAYRAVNTTLIQRNWLLGYRIASEELQGEDRAKYGAEIIKKLAKELSVEYGRGYTKSNLYSFYSFHKTYPEIFQTSSGKSVGLLSWSHYAALLQVKDEKARDWYEKEVVEQTWSVRTLQRNISSQYYYRMLKTQKKELVESEMKELTAPYQNDKLEFIKNPVIAEFLGLSSNTDFTESELESSILSNIQKFLMELGKGYAFVARQQHIKTEKQDYYIDLVFYNYILKCFVLIDLKTEKITHQDVGQMDMYIRMYDELKRSEGDNPTIGIVLCSDTDEDIARYSVMHGNEQLFASKYKLYLPTEEELRAEIDLIKAETKCIIEKLFELGKGDLAVGTVEGFAQGVMDVPFAPSKYNAGKMMPARDNNGAVRYLFTGNLPFTKDILDINREKLEERAKFEGRPVSFDMTTDDIFAVGLGRLIGRPKNN